jgi:nucleoside-diphosphate-sugar epimerase
VTVARVLVTGGTGVIASWVVRGFVERGITPIVLSRGPSDQIGGAINGDIADRCVHVRGDLLDPAVPDRAIAEHGAQAIVHMASAKPWQIEPPWVDRPLPRQAIDQIASATAHVLEAARRHGVTRVVYASSKAVFDDVSGPYAAPEYRPLPADYLCRPRMLYGIGKLAAEHLGFYYARQFGLEFLAIRFASAFGPLKRGPTATSPDGMLYAALAGEPVRIRRFRDGERDDYVYNKDVAQAFVLAALAPRPTHLAYNIGSGRGSDHNDFARALRAVVPTTMVEFADPDSGGAGAGITDRARCIMDNSPAAADFGYAPRYASLEAAFADFVSEHHRLERARTAPRPAP